MMRILHFNLAKEFGGGEVQTLNLLHWLSFTGLEQVVVARNGSPFARRVLEEIPAARCVTVVEAFRLLAGMSAQSRQGTVLHAHDGRSLHLCSLLKSLFSIPYLATRRVDKGLPQRWLSRRSYRRADRLVAVSNRIAERIEAGLGSESCVRIPDSFSGFAADQSETEKIRERFAGKTLVGQIGSLYEIKGHRYTIEAARDLAAVRPELHFVLLGEGGARPELERQADGLTNLTLVGFVRDVGNWLAALDLLVHPSLREGLGSILLEAQQFGVPVIASKVGGIPDVVIDGKTGLLVPPADSRELQGAILKLLDDRDLRNRVVEGARRHLDGFRPDVVGQAYLDLYQEIVSKP